MGVGKLNGPRQAQRPRPKKTGLEKCLEGELQNWCDPQFRKLLLAQGPSEEELRETFARLGKLEMMERYLDQLFPDDEPAER